MRIDGRQVPVGRKLEPLSKTSMIASRSFGPPVEAPRATHKALITAQDRRHAQRVMLRIRASIHVALHGKEATFNVTTLSVNRGGALLVMERSLPPDTHVVLENAQTRQRVACRVTRSAREMAGGFQVPIEFDSPAPDFWKIAFPPSDWRPTD
jgi:hypothetical protein